MATKNQPAKITREDFLAKLESMIATPEVGESKGLQLIGIIPLLWSSAKAMIDGGVLVSFTLAYSIKVS